LSRVANVAYWPILLKKSGIWTNVDGSGA
jgi:hypothetical protein